MANCVCACVHVLDMILEGGDGNDDGGSCHSSRGSLNKLRVSILYLQINLI